MAVPAIRPRAALAVPFPDRPIQAAPNADAILKAARPSTTTRQRRRREDRGQHFNGVEQPRPRRARLDAQQQVPEAKDRSFLDPITNSAPIADHEEDDGPSDFAPIADHWEDDDPSNSAPIDDREEYEGPSDSVHINGDSDSDSDSDSEAAEFAPDPLADEGQLFHDRDEAADQFPEFFDDEVPTLHYNLDSQKGREGAADLLGFDYEYLTLLTPQEMMSVALYKVCVYMCYLTATALLTIYKVKTKNGVTREAHMDYCKVFSEQAKFPSLDMRTVQKIIQRATGVAHISYDVCINNCFCFATCLE